MGPCDVTALMLWPWREGSFVSKESDKPTDSSIRRPGLSRCERMPGLEEFPVGPAGELYLLFFVRHPSVQLAPWYSGVHGRMMEQQ